MKIGAIILISLMLLCGGASRYAQVNSDRSHQQWLEERYKEAISIKPGMNRADLLKLFDEDGGLQTIPASRYVLKNCPLIQIEVKFDAKYGVDYKPMPDNDLKITKVSNPYLQYMALD